LIEEHNKSNASNKGNISARSKTSKVFAISGSLIGKGNHLGASFTPSSGVKNLKAPEKKKNTNNLGNDKTGPGTVVFSVGSDSESKTGKELHNKTKESAELDFK
jgi:hypothetical protein